MYTPDAGMNKKVYLFKSASESEVKTKTVLRYY